MGEALGFAAPGLAWFGAWKLGFPPLALAATVVAEGAVEGLVLGWSQRHALRPAFDPRAAWVVVTSAVAALAWTSGMAPNVAYDLGAPVAVAVALAVLGAPVILLSIGVAQSWILGRFVPKPRRWIWINILAWVLALPISFVGPALVPNGSPDWAFGLAWVAAGVVMAAALAAVTGEGMRRLLKSPTAPG